MWVFIYQSICAHAYTYMDIYINTHTHTHTHTHTYIYIYIYIYKCVCVILCVLLCPFLIALITRFFDCFNPTLGTNSSFTNLKMKIKLHQKIIKQNNKKRSLTDCLTLSSPSIYCDSIRYRMLHPYLCMLPFGSVRPNRKHCLDLSSGTTNVCRKFSAVLTTTTTTTITITSNTTPSQLWLAFSYLLPQIILFIQLSLF